MNSSIDFVCEFIYIFFLNQAEEGDDNEHKGETDRQTDRQTGKLISTINSQFDQICREL